MMKMRKGFLVAIACAGLFFVAPQVHAEELDEIPTEETLVMSEASTESNDELFAEYAQQTLDEALESENVALRQNALDVSRYTYLGSAEQTVYNYWLSQIASVADGSTNNASIRIPLKLYLTNFTYTASDLGLTTIDTDSKEFSDALKNAVTPDLSSVYLALLSDRPYELYWHDKVTGAAIGYNLSYHTGNNGVEQMVTIDDDAFILVRMTVANDYATERYKTNTTKTGATKTAVTNAKAVVSNADSKTDYEKLVYYRDWIVTNTSYNHTAANTQNYPYGDPWQLIYVFDDNDATKVTCEGYSKAFKYLCDLSKFSNADIDCYLMSGTMDGDPHMWNTVFMDDKQNYIVDLTNYDATFPSCLFLSGYNAAVDNGYRFNVGDTTSNYIYDDDALSTYTSLELTIAPYNYGTQTIPTDPIEAFVTRMYRVVFQREPDADGLADWTAKLKSGKATGSEVMVGFYLSDEMMNRGLTNSEYVEVAYLGLFDRASDADGKRGWVEALDNGVSYQYIVRGFTGSDEFKNLCKSYGIVQGEVKCGEFRDQNPNITAFTNRLYTCILNRNSEVDGLNYWCKSIVMDPSRQNILNIATNGFLHSEEFALRNLNDTEYVKVLYRVFLDREYESEGLQYWVKQLKSGVSRDTVAEGFANSEEFGNLMTSYGL